jgi:vancomycin resistance protein YoaR
LQAAIMKLKKEKIANYFLFSLVFFISLVLLVLIAYQLAYRQKIYPGIKVAGWPVGNQTHSQANQELEQLIRFSLEKNPDLQLIGDHQQLTINLKDLKLNYQVDSILDQAYQFGREKSPWQEIGRQFGVWRKGLDFDLEYQLDQNYLQEKTTWLAGQVFIPATEPSIEIIESPDKDSQIAIHRGQAGQELNSRLFAVILDQKLKRLDFTPLQVPLLTISPALTDNEAEKLTQEAEKLLDKTLILVSEDKEWILEEKELISFLSFSNGFDQLKIAEYVSQLAESIDRLPQNAAFQFEGGRVIEFKAAKKGQALDQLKTVVIITDSLKELEKIEEKRVNLAVSFTDPSVTTADVNNLGIKTLIGRGESWFRGSISSRIHNLQLASSRLNGLLLPPGEIFSFNQRLGDVSQATGYQKAYIIKEGRTILDDGGGVCQVSTTLFRAVLNAGLPIIERHAHAYRVYYYEQNSLVGLDATVFAPTADLKFKNDTDSFILIQAEVDLSSRKLTFNLYGSSDNRKIEISKTRIWDQTAPPPDLYQDDPTLPVGTTKQIDWSAWGAKAAFDWKVTRGDEILQERTFYSNYKPWQAIYLVGTKPE